MRIRGGSYINRLRCLLIFAFINGCFGYTFCQQINYKTSNDIVATIDLQGGFDKDTISISINNTRFIHNLIVTSNSITEYTGFSLRIKKSSPGKLRMIYKKESKPLKEFAGNMFITLLVNGSVSEFETDLIDGKYIGITKRNGILELIQLERVIYYD
ncbi:MAG: hypothetical protein V4717_14835 [Bacteroidota bacterium]